MAEIILYGPDSEAFNQYAAVSPAPGNNGAGGQVALRGVRPLGTQLVLQDGRKYRFSLAGGSDLVVGNVITGPASVSTDLDMTPAAGAVNDRIITFTHGAATTAINVFAEGYGFITVTPGLADTYKIASHAALQNATAGDIVNLAPGNALRRALTTSSRLSLRRNPYAEVIQSAANTLTGSPCGVAVAAIVSGQFGWLQTRGPCGVLVIGTVVIGQSAVVPTATAGGAGPLTLTEGTPNTGGGVPIIGRVLVVEATTQATLIDLTLDG